MNRTEFDSMCISNADISTVILEALKSIKNDKECKNYCDTEFLSRISQQIIISKKDELWPDILKICDEEVMNTDDSMAKVNIYKVYLNYYNHMGLSPKVIEYALKYEKLGLDEIENYEVFQMAAFNFYETGFYDRAIEYILKALSALKNVKEGSSLFKVMDYNNLVYCYAAIDRMDKALESYNRFRQIVRGELESDDMKKVDKLFKMCSLFIQIKIEESENRISEELIEKYIKYVDEMSDISNYQIMESEDVHLIFIDYIVRSGRLNEAVNICKRLIKNENISGNKKSIYKRLLSIYQIMGDVVPKQEYFDIVVTFNDILQKNNERYDEIMHELVGEQFRLIDMENKYKEMKSLYVVDALTGCYNRKAFDKRIEENKKCRDSGIIIFLDLDNLKYVNDTYGHNNGDTYIRYFSYLTNNVMDAESKIYRYGGDEFIIISRKNEDEGISLVRRMEQAFKEPCKLIAPDVFVTFSYGISEFGFQMDIEQAIKEADKKMYINKKEKKRKVVIRDV